ncbi:MAG TPA: hypothetical protein VN132_09245, partial [Bdellovibrio sp.]|nr:hypothetical protein [Bdellovibrio sp.]
AVQWAESHPSSVVQFPLFDINYGYGDHIQLNLNTSLATVKDHEAGQPSSQTSGLSLASIAVKWRFVDEETSGISISTYPRYDFHHSLASDDPLVNAPGNRFFIPIEFSKEFGKFGVNPEIGYASYSEFTSEWVYGLATSYAFEKEKEILFEVHGRTRVTGSEHEFQYNIGTRYLLAEYCSFIGSAGKTVSAYSDGSIAWNVYAGFQFRL